MEVYRLSRKKYALPLSGIGASFHGARWNSAGYDLIYSAENRSLAMAEVAVHLTFATLPLDFVMMTLNIPGEIMILTLDENKLLPDWNTFPFPVSTQHTGDKFISDCIYCVLKVPSAVTKGDHNFLINPNHPDFKKITVKSMEDFPFDRRIFNLESVAKSITTP